jgi:hypothetical protein
LEAAAQQPNLTRVTYTPEQFGYTFEGLFGDRIDDIAAAARPYQLKAGTARVDLTALDNMVRKL